MLSAVFTEDGVSYVYTLNNTGVGTNRPTGARWEHYESMRVRDNITISPYVGPTDLQNWKEQMHLNDRELPRFAEDILDGMADKSGVAQITLDRLQAKKTLRETKP